MPNDRAGSRGSPDIRFVFSVMRTRPEISLFWFLLARDILKLASGRFIVHTSALPRRLCDRIAAVSRPSSGLLESLIERQNSSSTSETRPVVTTGVFGASTGGFHVGKAGLHPPLADLMGAM
jgi:hypothetical protein